MDQFLKTAVNKATAYQCDVSLKSSVDECVKSILSIYPRIDILVTYLFNFLISSNQFVLLLY